VLNTFQMPALHLIPEGMQRVADVRAMNIFNEGIFLTEVYQPLLHRLGLTRKDLTFRQKVFTTT
jgi:hypothetical protein